MPRRPTDTHGAIATGERLMRPPARRGSGGRRQPEKAEQAAIVDLLRQIGARVYVLGTTRPRGDHMGTCQTAGIPDLYAFLPNPPAWKESTAAVWIEVKASGGRLSVAQREFVSQCERAGVSHLTGGLDAVIAYLRAGGWVK